jgi:hypothetical protein
VSRKRNGRGLRLFVSVMLRFDHETWDVRAFSINYDTHIYAALHLGPLVFNAQHEFYCWPFYRRKPDA